MTKPLSLDLRERVVAAVDDGTSRRQAAERFGVGVASAIRWCKRARDTGSPKAAPQGGDRRSGRIEGVGAISSVQFAVVRRKSTAIIFFVGPSKFATSLSPRSVPEPGALLIKSIGSVSAVFFSMPGDGLVTGRRPQWQSRRGSRRICSNLNLIT